MFLASSRTIVRPRPAKAGAYTTIDQVRQFTSRPESKRYSTRVSFQVDGLGTGPRCPVFWVNVRVLASTLNVKVWAMPDVITGGFLATMGCVVSSLALLSY